MEEVDIVLSFDDWCEINRALWSFASDYSQNKYSAVTLNEDWPVDIDYVKGLAQRLETELTRVYRANKHDDAGAP